MNLGDYMLRRRQEALRRPDLTHQQTVELVEDLTDAALVALRAGVVPRLTDLAESREAEEAWVTAAQRRREEIEWERRGVDPEHALEHVHDTIHAQIRAKRAARQEG